MQGVFLWRPRFRGYAAVLAGHGIDIRRCERRDLPEVLALWDEERSEHASTPDRIEDLERLLADSPAALLVAEQNGAIVGAMIAAWDGWRGNMYRLAVQGSHRREGVATALTRAGEDYLRDRGAGRITALVAHDDQAAGSFWDSVGYPLDPLMGRRVRNL
jgi:ribosomal protein S18 acetylase RimI-like enzyme